MPYVRLDLSHGAVGEIADMYSCAHDLLNALFLDKAAEEWKDVLKKTTTQAKRLSSKQKTKLGEYLVKTVTMSSENIETEGEGNNLLDDSMSCNSMLGKQNVALRKEIQKLTHVIPTTTVVVVTLSIPTTTVVVVDHSIPTTTLVVVDNDLSNFSAGQLFTC